MTQRKDPDIHGPRSECDLALPRQQTPDRLNDGDPWLVGLDVSVAEGEDVADGPRPHQFAEPGRVVLDDYYFKKY